MEEEISNIPDLLIKKYPIFFFLNATNKYTLSLNVDSSESATALSKFIENVPDFYQLRFNKVTWDLIDKGELITSLYKRIVMLNSPDKVFVNNHQRFIYEYLLFDSLKNYKIPYVDHLEKIGEIKYAEKLGSLEITQRDLELGNIKGIKIPVKEFIFRDRHTLDLIFNKPLKFDKILLHSLESLYFVEIPLAWVALGISALSGICKNLKEFRVYFEKKTDFSLGLFEHIQNIQNKIKCTSIELNYKYHIKPTITKSFMKLIYKEGTKLKIINTSKAYIQLSDNQEEIIHHTPDYLILSSLNS